MRRADAPQLEARIALTPKRERQYRHVVDGSRFDEWSRGAGWNDIRMRCQLLLEPHHGSLFVFTNVEADDD